MAEIHFTSHLRNLVTDGPLSAAGATVGEALANVLAAQPHVRSYGSTIAGIYANMSAYSPTASAWRTTARSHDGALARRIDPDSKLYVMQALSGG
jgi:hypothetical protein